MVAPWLASVNVPSRTVGGGVCPSIPVISVPLELVSGASTVVAVVVVGNVVAPPTSLIVTVMVDEPSSV